MCKYMIFFIIVKTLIFNSTAFGCVEFAIGHKLTFYGTPPALRLWFPAAPAGRW